MKGVQTELREKMAEGKEKDTWEQTVTKQHKRGGLRSLGLRLCFSSTVTSGSSVPVKGKQYIMSSTES